MTATNTPRLIFIVDFFFIKNRMPSLSVSITWLTDKLDIDDPAFVSFLYKNESNLHNDDIKFAFMLTKIANVFKQKNCFVISKAAQQRQFFKDAHTLGIVLHLPTDNGYQLACYAPPHPLPLTLTLSQQTTALCCEMKEWVSFANEPYYAVLIYDDDSNESVIICNGVVLLDPPTALFVFLIQFLRKKRIYYYHSDAYSFIKQVYEPCIGFINWDVQTDLYEYKPATTHPTPNLTVHVVDNTITPTLSYYYADIKIEADSDKKLIKIPNKKFTIKRDFASEKAYQDRLMTLFIDHDVPFLLTNPDDIAKFMTRVVPVLKNDKWDLDIDIPSVMTDTDTVSLEFTLQKQSDWFYYKPDCDILDESFSLNEMASMMVENQGYIPTKNGYVKLSDKTQQDLTLLHKAGAFSNQNRFSETELLALASQTDTIGQDQDTQTAIQKAKSFSELDPVSVSSDFKGQLRDYQQFGLNWITYLYNNQLGGILADDMGLGKTIQTLAFISQLPPQSKILVIGPTNVIYNWNKEIHTFLPSKRVLIYAGSDRKAHELDQHDIVVTSFGILKNDRYLFTERHFNCMLVDEAQYIKNHKTQLSRAIKSLSADFKLVMTGTPIENNIHDLWNLFDCVLPGYLGKLREFEQSFKTSDEASQRIKIKIKPFVLRRDKKTVLASLPEKTEIILKCTLSDSQRQLYETVLTAVKQGVRNYQGQSAYLNILTGLLKLRQVCSHPGLLAEFKNRKIESEKFELAKSHIQELLGEGHKIVLFSQFTAMLTFFQSWLEENNLAYERIDGQVTGKARHAAIERFQTSEQASIFLISLKAGGVGINLTAADYVIHFDPWWNPAIEAQATDRVHRMGQKNKVIIYKFITDNTIEEKILALQTKKKALLSHIIESDGATDKLVDMKELASVLLD